MRTTALAALFVLTLGAFTDKGGAAPIQAPSAAPLTQARAEAARARDRAAALDRQVLAATMASERAILAAAAMAARVQQAEAALSAADAELASVQRRHMALKRRLARERAPSAQLLAGLQTQVRRPPLLALLQPGSLKDAVHLRAVLATVGAQVSARTAKLRAALAQARRLENEVTRLAERRRAVRASLRARHADLAAMAAAEQLKARRAAGAAGDEAARALLLARRSETPSALAGRVDGARTRAAAATQPAVSARAPANGPDRMPVSGEARVGPGEGVAIAARPGALVVAPGSGRVAFAGPYRGFGGIVIIEHDGGWTSLVTGLARAEVVAGQRLVAGSPLGRASGGARAVGLEVWRNGRRVNPLDQLR